MVYMDFGKLLMYYCNSKKNPISLSRVVVGAEFTTGAEFSHDYGNYVGLASYGALPLLIRVEIHSKSW